MITISLPLALLLLPAGLIAGWYMARKKYRQHLTMQSSELNSRIVALEQDLYQQKQAAIQFSEEKARFSEEKAALSRDLDAALTAQSNTLKQKYDALYLKYIEVNNEKNRLKGQINNDAGK